LGAVLAIMTLAAGSTVSFGQVCEAQLVARTPYLCDVKSSFGGEFQDCFEFLTPHSTVPSSFQLTPVGLGDNLVCNCGASGKFGAPTFDSSSSFFCASQENGSGSTFVFLGKSIKGGKIIGKGQAFSEAGDQFVFSCKPDTTGTCGILANSRRGLPANENPWVNPER